MRVYGGEGQEMREIERRIGDLVERRRAGAASAGAMEGSAGRVTTIGETATG